MATAKIAKAKLFHYGKEYIARPVFDEKGYQITTEFTTELVRCGECEHKADNYCYKHSHEVTDSDFCSCGERKE